MYNYIFYINYKDELLNVNYYCDKSKPTVQFNTQDQVQFIIEVLKDLLAHCHQTLTKTNAEKSQTQVQQFIQLQSKYESNPLSLILKQTLDLQHAQNAQFTTELEHMIQESIKKARRKKKSLVSLNNNKTKNVLVEHMYYQHLDIFSKIKNSQNKQIILDVLREFSDQISKTIKVDKIFMDNINLIDLNIEKNSISKKINTRTFINLILDLGTIMKESVDPIKENTDQLKFNNSFSTIQFDRSQFVNNKKVCYFKHFYCLSLSNKYHLIKEYILSIQRNNKINKSDKLVRQLNQNKSFQVKKIQRLILGSRQQDINQWNMIHPQINLELVREQKFFQYLSWPSTKKYNIVKVKNFKQLYFDESQTSFMWQLFKQYKILFFENKTGSKDSPLEIFQSQYNIDYKQIVHTKIKNNCVVAGYLFVSPDSVQSTKAPTERKISNDSTDVKLRKLFKPALDSWVEPSILEDNIQTAQSIMQSNDEQKYSECWSKVEASVYDWLKRGNVFGDFDSFYTVFDKPYPISTLTKESQELDRHYNSVVTLYHKLIDNEFIDFFLRNSKNNFEILLLNKKILEMGNCQTEQNFQNTLSSESTHHILIFNKVMQHEPMLNLHKHRLSNSVGLSEHDWLEDEAIKWFFLITFDSKESFVSFRRHPHPFNLIDNDTDQSSNLVRFYLKKRDYMNTTILNQAKDMLAKVLDMFTRYFQGFMDFNAEF